MIKSGFVKFLIRAAAVILLLLLITWAFLSYRQSTSYKHTIHQDAEHIIKVSTDQIVKKVALNAMANPLYYTKSTENDTIRDEENTESLGRGFNLPANLFFFTLKDYPNSIFCRLALIDSANFRAFATRKLNGANATTNVDYSTIEDQGQRLQIFYNADHLAVGYSIDKRDLSKPLAEILLRTSMLEPDEHILDRLKSNTHDIALIDDDMVIGLDFLNNAIEVSGQLPSQIKNSVRPISMLNELATVHFTLSGDIPEIWQKPYSIHDITLPLDSLSKYYDGYTDIMLGGKVEQTDTMISYEYDDDFEKVEVKTLKKRLVPATHISISADAIEAKRLLNSSDILTDAKINRKIFPFYDLHLQGHDSTLLTLTNTELQSEITKVDSEKAFRLYVNFPALQDSTVWPAIFSKTSHMQSLLIEGSAQEGRLIINGRLQFDNEDINALMLLIAGIKQ